MLLARDYEEATALVDRYGDNIIGLVTDARFPGTERRIRLQA